MEINAFDLLWETVINEKKLRMSLNKHRLINERMTNVVMFRGLKSSNTIIIDCRQVTFINPLYWSEAKEEYIRAPIRYKVTEDKIMFKMREGYEISEGAKMMLRGLQNNIIIMKNVLSPFNSIFGSVIEHVKIIGRTILDDRYNAFIIDGRQYLFLSKSFRGVFDEFSKDGLKEVVLLIPGRDIRRVNRIKFPRLGRLIKMLPDEVFPWRAKCT